ncbi:hypothetical protein BJV82DRAFT_667701 [Fennellomyces sp. T-0311]|nr:hypothetical protein BJV82DRAFT_667701 [Fennellomyces sp. T-0311]
MYYFGGAVAGTDSSNPQASGDLYYLDIENSFSVSQANSQWQLAPSSDGSSAEGGYFFGMDVIPDVQAIMIYGGNGGNGDMQNPAILYDATRESWNEYPNPMPGLKQMAMVALQRGDNGKAYIFGGRSVLTANPVFPPFNRLMHIYDYAAGSWTDGAALPNQFPVRYFAPVTLAGKELVYIGGMTANYNDTAIIQDNIPIPLTNILIYNIDDNTWRQENATGNVPSNRILHTIASKPYTREVILYGGQTNRESGPIEGNYCYVLNLDSLTWEKKNPIGVGPGSLYGHSMVFADRSPLLFVLFGVNSTGQTQNSFSVLNTETWSWTSNYQSSYAGSDAPGSKAKGLSTGAIAGIVVGCIVGVGIIIGVLVFLCIRKRRDKKRHTHTAERYPTGEIPEAHVLQPMLPLSPTDKTPSSYNASADNKDHMPSEHFTQDDSSVPTYTAAKSDLPIFLHPAKPDENTSKHGGSSAPAPITMTPEKPDGASSIPRNDNIRSVKPDGA